MSIPVRAWMFTYFLKEEEQWDIISSTCLIEKIKYIIVNHELTQENKRHLQGYVYTNNSVRLTGIKKIINLDGAHFEMRKGTHKEAKEYCSKMDSRAPDTSPYEYGDEPEQGSRRDIKTVVKAIQNGENLRTAISLSANYQDMQIAEKLIKYYEKPREWKPFIRWYWGATGSGKSRKAFEESDPNDRWISMKSAQWFEGYDGHGDVIFDDMRGDFCKFHELLRLFDRYECRIECKGGSRQFLAKNIWVTSCYPPDKLYQTREDIQQLMRRIDMIQEFTAADGDSVAEV